MFYYGALSACMKPHYVLYIAYIPPAFRLFHACRDQRTKRARPIQLIFERLPESRVTSGLVRPNDVRSKDQDHKTEVKVAYLRVIPRTCTLNVKTRKPH